MTRPLHIPPAPRRSWLLCAVLIFALALSFVAIAAQVSSCSKVSAQVPDLTPEPSQQQRFTAIFYQLGSLGREIDPQSPDHREAQRRLQAGQVMCELAIVLAADPAFAQQVEQACGCLEMWWPGIQCPVCER